MYASPATLVFFTSDAVRHIPHPQDEQKIDVQVDDFSRVLSVKLARLELTRYTRLLEFKRLLAEDEGVSIKQVHLTIDGKVFPDTKRLVLLAHRDFVLKLLR